MTTLGERMPDKLLTISAELNATALRKVAESGVRALIQLAGDNPDRPGLEETPRRVVAALIEMTARPGDPAALLGRVFTNVGRADEMVTVGPIDFTSLCEHHMLPFSGLAWVSYIPRDGRVVGLSKLPRLVEHHARALQVQERMTDAIADDLVAHLDPVGVGVRVVASHSCMTMRGIRKPGADTQTTAVRGVMLDKPAARAEFLSAAR